MDIDEAIKQLQEEKRNGTKSLILAWWDAAAFEREDNADFASTAKNVERKMDWSNAHEDLVEMIRVVEKE